MLRNLCNRFNDFARSEYGAVTTDYVVLCTGVIGLGIAITAGVSIGTNRQTEALNAELSSIQVSAAPEPATSVSGSEAAAAPNWRDWQSREDAHESDERSSEEDHKED